MSLQELKDKVARLSAQDRARLRAHLDALETLSDRSLMEEWTCQNRSALAGNVVSREEAVARLKAAGKQIE